MFFLRDVLLVLGIAGAAALLLLAVWGVLRRRGTTIRALLTREEWVVWGKLLAIPLLALVLYLTSIALDLPANLFLYGRF